MARIYYNVLNPSIENSVYVDGEEVVLDGYDDVMTLSKNVDIRVSSAETKSNIPGSGIEGSLAAEVLNNLIYCKVKSGGSVVGADGVFSVPKCPSEAAPWVIGDIFYYSYFYDANGWSEGLEMSRDWKDDDGNFHSDEYGWDASGVNTTYDIAAHQPISLEVGKTYWDPDTDTYTKCKSFTNNSTSAKTSYSCRMEIVSGSGASYAPPNYYIYYYYVTTNSWTNTDIIVGQNAKYFRTFENYIYFIDDGALKRFNGSSITIVSTNIKDGILRVLDGKLCVCNGDYIWKIDTSTGEYSIFTPVPKIDYGSYSVAIYGDILQNVNGIYMIDPMNGVYRYQAYDSWMSLGKYQPNNTSDLASITYININNNIYGIVGTRLYYWDETGGFTEVGTIGAGDPYGWATISNTLYLLGSQTSTKNVFVKHNITYNTVDYNIVFNTQDKMSVHFDLVESNTAWQQTNNGPGYQPHQLVLHDGYIYAFGAGLIAPSLVKKWDDVNQIWLGAPTLPYGISSTTLFVDYNNVIYMFYKKEIWYLNDSTGTWVKHKRSMPYDTTGATATVYHDFDNGTLIHIFGGKGSNAKKHYTFNGSSKPKAWAALDFACTNGQAIVYKSYLYLAIPNYPSIPNGRSLYRITYATRKKKSNYYTYKMQDAPYPYNGGNCFINCGNMEFQAILPYFKVNDTEYPATQYSVSTIMSIADEIQHMYKFGTVTTNILDNTSDIVCGIYYNNQIIVFANGGKMYHQGGYKYYELRYEKDED